MNKDKKVAPPLLQVYTTQAGAMYDWIKQGRPSGKEKIFYSANSLHPLLHTLRKIDSLEKLDELKEELMIHIDNINNIDKKCQDDSKRL